MTPNVDITYCSTGVLLYYWQNGIVFLPLPIVGLLILTPFLKVSETMVWLRSCCRRILGETLVIYAPCCILMGINWLPKR
jgi:hypothetical protein